LFQAIEFPASTAIALRPEPMQRMPSQEWG